MATIYNIQSIVTENLVLCLDAGNPASYIGSGTSWNDISGNSNNLTVASGNSFPTFNSEGYFTYDKSKTVLQTPSNDILNSTSFYKKTFSVWFKTASSFDASNSRGILTMGGSGSNIVIYINDNDLYMGMKKSGVIDGATTTLTTDTWYNATWVLDAADSSGGQADVQKLYVNGSSIGTAEGHRISTSQPLAIGGGSVGANITGSNLYGYDVHSETLYNSDNANSAYDGAISLVTVYNRALSAAEVLQNYNMRKRIYNL